MSIALAVFGLILAIILGSYWFFVLRLEEQEDRALKKRLKTPRHGLAAAKTGFVKARDQLSSVGALDKVLARSEHLVDPLQGLIDRSGKSINVGTMVLACGFAVFATMAVLMNVQPFWYVAVAGGLLAGYLPILYLKWMANRRMALFEEQFPEAIDLMARALRAGHALTTALQMAGEEMPEPVGSEFKLVFDQQNYGMSLADALREMAARIPVLDARIFVTALLTQRETGGNLSEVLDNIASVIRERFKVKRQVRVISAHGRITGWVLGALPPVMVVVLFILSPSHILMLRDDPLGVRIVLIGIALQIIGVLIIRKIIDVEY